MQTVFNFDWNAIDTVLLDMDGTLLDLHFDNHFWLEYVPLRYAERHGITPDAAKALLMERYKAVEGTLDWYCVDYWSRELALDIPLLKEEVAHLIQVHPHVLDFLTKLGEMGLARVLVTNAHQKALQLKLKRTPLGGLLDQIVSSHELGLPKENPAFWERLAGRIHYDPKRALLIDDSQPVLESAFRFGIAHLLQVTRPDSRQPPRESGPYPAISDFQPLLQTSVSQRKL